MSFSLRLGNALTRFSASSRLTCSRSGRSILTFGFKAFIIILRAHYAGSASNVARLKKDEGLGSLKPHLTAGFSGPVPVIVVSRNLRGAYSAGTGVRRGSTRRKYRQ